MKFDVDALLCPAPLKLPEDVKVVLGSGSPRRKELCSKMGLSFTVVPADCDESYDQNAVLPCDAVELLSERKCLAVAEVVGKDALVIASDTIVDLNGHVLGKPKDVEDAIEMLRGLSGNSHFVHTGVAVAYGGRCLVSHDSTEVVFRALSEEEMRAYAESEEPKDKAGAYAIQGDAGAFVSAVNGAFDTVVGLPCEVLSRLILKILEESR